MCQKRFPRASSENHPGRYCGYFQNAPPRIIFLEGIAEEGFFAAKRIPPPQFFPPMADKTVLSFV